MPRLSFVHTAIKTTSDATSIYADNLLEVPRLMVEWNTAFPKIRLFFAVKSNSDLRLIRTLHENGVGYDCASPLDIDLVRSLGAKNDDILCANPIKLESNIRDATAKGITQMSFDRINELHKIRANANGPFGAEPQDWSALFAESKALGLHTGGICFHLDSGCMNATAYAQTITQAADCIELASTYGFSIDALNMGGGFASPLNTDVVQAINETIDDKIDPSIRVIAEPGRFFAEIICTVLLANAFEVWEICMIISSMRLVAAPVTLFPSNIYGATCHCGDIVSKDVLLPQYNVGDWLEFPRMGVTHTCLQPSSMAWILKIA
ncbi:hypothetical protein THRCLA_06408 [Thraustotheca clavata]|uniref:ornithine decarboxylase n=1 Tax=Thraustotheca clavata TaxID=74557 RepID=A0A1V9ZP18_9STRA|nr:hypothetical protein THRCLA_06408 [Thraustotheca clavata]